MTGIQVKILDVAPSQIDHRFGMVLRMTPPEGYRLQPGDAMTIHLALLASFTTN